MMQDPFNVVLWILAGLALLAALVAAPDRRPAWRIAAQAALLLAALGLMAALADGRLMPAASMIVHRDGSTDDPRVLSALALGLAALGGPVLALRALRLRAAGWMGAVLPGVFAAGLIASVGYFARLHQPAGVIGLVLGGLGMGLGVTALVRVWGRRSLAFGAAEGLGASLLVVAATLALHGARAEGLRLAEGGAALDTLGMRVSLRSVEAPDDSLRRLNLLVQGARDTSEVALQLRGRKGTPVRSIAAGPLFSGPLLVPMGLQEVHGDPHEMVWLAKGAGIERGGVRITFRGFRTGGSRDSVRFSADLDVVSGGRTFSVSPGMVAARTGETPYAADVPGYGPIAVARIDADGGRVAVVLPRADAGPVSRVAVVDLRLRPGLAVAWAGALITLLGFLAALPFAGTARRGVR